MKPVASIIFGIAMLLVSGNQPLAQEWHRGDGPYRGLQCPAGEHLVPIRNGVKCQKIPVCGPDQTITPGPKGVECKEVEHIESVHVERPLYAFFPARAGNDLDGICMAWLPKYRYRSHMKDDLLPPYAHVDNRGFVATWSYDLDVKGKKITITDLRPWGALDALGRRPWGAPVKLDIPLPLYDSPQKDWPCSKEMWTTLLEIPQPQDPGTVTVPTIILNPDCGLPRGQGKPRSCVFQ